MPWYVAHAILMVRLKEGAQRDFPIWENAYLISAENDRIALEKAKLRAQEDSGDAGGSFKCNGQLAGLEFVGIRKLILCEDSDLNPESGAEVTYSQFTANSEQEVQDLAQGKTVQIKYEA